MSRQQGQHSQAFVSRTTTGKIVGVGVAGLTAAFSFAPAATAAAPDPSPAPSPGVSATHAAAKVAPSPAVETITSSPVEPDYGTQKIRIGVQIKSGAYVPDGTTTGGSTVSIVETGPNAAQAKALYGDSCTTVAGSEQAPATETFCSFTPRIQVKQAGAKAQAKSVSASPFDYQAQPGDTVVITQTGTGSEFLLKDPVAQTFGPCVDTIVIDRRVAAADDVPTCNTESALEATFTDAGLPPVAVDDSTGTLKVDSGPVDVQVLGNDTAHAPVTDLQVTGDPSHGTAVVKPALKAQVVGAANPGATTITYTPDAGFTGTDSFRYTVTTANGTASARVTVRVAAPAASSSAAPTSTTPTTSPTVAPSSSTAPIANTGVANGELLEIALGLIAAGAAAGVAGRRVYRGRHSH